MTTLKSLGQHVSVFVEATKSNDSLAVSKTFAGAVHKSLEVLHKDLTVSELEGGNVKSTVSKRHKEIISAIKNNLNTANGCLMTLINFGLDYRTRPSSQNVCIEMTLCAKSLNLLLDLSAKVFSKLPNVLCVLARIICDCGSVIETEQSQDILMAQARCRFSALQIFTTIAKTPSMCKQLMRMRNSDGVPVILASCLRTLHFKSSQFDPHSVQASLHLLRNLLLPPENRRTIGAFVLDTTTPVSSTTQVTSAKKVSSAPAPAPTPPQTVFQILRSWIKHKDPNVQMSAAVILRLLVSECAENVLRLSDGLLLDDMLSMPLERTHPCARAEHARFLAITLKTACGSIETVPPLPPATTGAATAATASATTPSATGTDTTAVDAATSAVKTLTLNSPSGAVLSRVASLVSLQRICFLLASRHAMLHKEALTALLAAEEAARTGHDCCKQVYGLMGSSVAKASTSSSSQSIAADAFKLNGESLKTILKRLAAENCEGAEPLLSKLQK